MRRWIATAWIATLLSACVIMLLLGRCSVERPERKSALFQIKLDRRWGFIDDHGRVVVPPKFEVVNGSGRNVVCARSPEGWVEVRMDADTVKETPIGCEADALMVCRIGEGMYGLVGDDGVCGVYDPDGQFKGEYDDDWHIQGFREGLLPAKIEGKYGFVDREGQVIIQPRYDLAFGFRERIASVTRDRKWGYIDREGRIIVEPTFEIVDPFVSGVAVVFDGEACWFIKRDGTLAFDSEFCFAGSFSGGLARVKGFERDALYGYIDRSGNYAISPRYERAADFSDGLAAVTYGEEGLRGNTRKVMGYIDPGGSLAIRVEDARKLYDFRNGLALVRTDTWMGYINKMGECVWKTDKPWTPPLSEQ